MDIDLPDMPTDEEIEQLADEEARQREEAKDKQNKKQDTKQSNTAFTHAARPPS